MQMTGIERLRELTDATLGYVRVASVTPHDYEYENDVEWDERMRLSELLASIYSQISREQDAMVADSPYDAILPEDRDAIAWVREHGGLAEVKEEWNARSNLKRSLETAQAKVERQQRLIEFAQRKCHERLERIAALNKTIAEMRPRLMPEGMEWPTVDGKPVDFVTGYEPSLGVLEAVSIYNNGACEVMGHDGIINSVTEIHISAPKVLDADGVEIRVGDEVWDVDGSGPFIVSGFVGEPLAVILEIAECNDLPRKPSQLTHTKPEIDTWERIEEDAYKDDCEYFGRDLNGCEGCPASRQDIDNFYCDENEKASDLVRRAKVLAERGA